MARVPKGHSVTDPDEDDRLARLEARIESFKGKEAPKPHQETSYSQAQLAWRMVIELVSGLMIGFAMGYGLDRLLGTLPIFLVVLTLLGLAAGIRTMLRSAREIQQQQADGAADDTPQVAKDKRAKNGE